MIDIPRVDLGPAVEQQVDHLHRSREVQRPPAVAALGVHERRVGVEQLTHAIQTVQVRGSEDVDGGSARD